MRDRGRAAIISVAAVIFAAALVRQFQRLGGPYFEIPLTVQDHVAPVPYASRDVILLARRAAELLPRGVTVTALQPSQAPNFDITHYQTAMGMMPHHRVVLPKVGDTDRSVLPHYVLAVREPFVHPAYRLYRSLPEGRIYKRTP